MWVKSEGSHNTTVLLYCCPNGGFYEYIYYQTDWLEFYSELGVSIVLWNYRGYGRSQGSPTIPKLCRDGEVLINYLRTCAGVTQIVVHGESLGGSIAAHVATKCKCEMLVADRTFASLFETVRSYVGLLLAYAVKLLGPQDVDSVHNYLEFPRTKVITCDPSDGIIDDRASLKSGIARLVSAGNLSVTPEMVGDFARSLKYFSGMKGKYIQVESPGKNKRKGYKLAGNKQVYKTLNTEDCEFGIENLVAKVLEIGDEVDAGGMSLGNLMQKDEKGIWDWVFVLLVWGSSPVSYSAEEYDLRMATVQKLNKCTIELARVLHEFSQSQLIAVRDAIKHVNAYQKIMLGALGVLENRKMRDKRLGDLIILQSGHCGSFNSVEKYLYEKLLRASGLLE